MSLVDRILRRRSGPPSVDLQAVKHAMMAAVLLLPDGPVDRDLVRARLADCYRDMQLDPPRPADLDEACELLDDEALRRFAVLARVMESPAMQEAAPLVIQHGDVAGQVLEGLATPSVDHDLLTIELLCQSPLRIEELARHFLAAMKLRITGESVDESNAKRMLLDYKRLLEEASKAEKDAEERTAALRERRDEVISRRRRGKW